MIADIDFAGGVGGEGGDGEEEDEEEGGQHLFLSGLFNFDQNLFLIGTFYY